MKKILYAWAAIFLLQHGLHAQSTPKEWYDKGITLKKAGNCKDAINAFKKAISLKAGYADALHQLGWCYNEQLMYSEAIDALKKEQASNPSDKASNFFELGYAYKGQREYDQAMEYFNSAIELNGQYALAYKERGNTWYKKADYANALNDYEKYGGLAKTITDASFFYNKGWCENETKKYNEAVKSLRQSVTLNDHNADAFAELGFAYYELNLNDNAIENYRISMALSEEKDYHPILGIADVYFDNLRNYDSAIVYYEKGVKLQKKNKSAFFRLGWCYNDRLKFSDAIQPLLDAIQLDADYSKARIELGYAYYKLDQYDNALAQFRPVMSMDAKDELSRYYSGFCYSLKGDQDDLKKMIDELREINSTTSLKYVETLNKYVK